MIDSRFGTWRGAVRLGLAHVERRAGRAAEVPVDPANVQRLVFVCQGNICRSAYAEAIARRLNVDTASFGLSTGSGLSADPAAMVAASELGVDLSAHRTTAAADFVAKPGDLLLAMEVRQMHRLATDPRFADIPRALLGATVGVPHLHDPFGLSPAYFLTCFRRIEAAVTALAALYPQARPDGLRSPNRRETGRDRSG